MPAESTMEFTQTRIDIADFHTTLYYLHDQSGSTSSLGIHSPAAYEQLYRQVAAQEESGYAYQEAAGGGQGIFDKLYPFYQKTKFWQWYVPYGRSTNFWRYAWDELVPLKVSVTPRVSYVPVTQTSFPQLKVSPIPRVLLFPFGWSNWLSLLIDGKHSLAGLSSLVLNIVNQPVFEVANCGSHNRISILNLFQNMSDAAQNDAFDEHAEVRYTPEFLIVVTVLVRGTAFLSTGALLPSKHLRPLRDIVSPANPHLSNAKIKKQTYEIDGNVNFIVWDKFGRFIWFHRLLDSRDKGNYMRLNCYHRNTFQALTLGWHQIKLLEEALRKIKNPHVSGPSKLLKHAVGKLQNPLYKSAGLYPLLDDTDVKKMLGDACKKLKIP